MLRVERSAEIRIFCEVFFKILLEIRIGLGRETLRHDREADASQLGGRDHHPSQIKPSFDPASPLLQEGSFSCASSARVPACAHSNAMGDLAATQGRFIAL